MLKVDPILADMSEADLEELRAVLHDTAQLAFDVYWAKKYGSKYPVGILPVSQERRTI